MSALLLIGGMATAWEGTLRQPVAAGIAAYFVIAGEGIAHYVEAPFGRDEDQLDLEGICATIDRSVSEILLEGRALGLDFSATVGVACDMGDDDDKTETH